MSSSNINIIQIINSHTKLWAFETEVSIFQQHNIQHQLSILQFLMVDIIPSLHKNKKSWRLLPKFVQVPLNLYVHTQFERPQVSATTLCLQ